MPSALSLPAKLALAYKHKPAVLSEKNRVEIFGVNVEKRCPEIPQKKTDARTAAAVQTLNTHRRNKKR